MNIYFVIDKSDNDRRKQLWFLLTGPAAQEVTL